MATHYSNNTSKPSQKFAFLLNEDKDPANKKMDEEIEANFLETMIQLEAKTAELQVTRLGKLLAEKICLHAAESVEMFGPQEILASSSITLAPVLYRIAVEGFFRHSNAPFKIIECRHVTKLSSDWKPSVAELLVELGHEIIVVDLKDVHSAYYNDFAYSILRQLDYEWKERLPRSFFYPDDVCSVISRPECHLMIISQTLPDGEMEFSNVKNKLEQNLLSMLKNSCLSALQNHLLLRDLRIGKLGDAMDGIECIRRIYRELQRRIKSGEKVILGTPSEEMLKLYMATKAGLTISSAESILTACKILDLETAIQETSDNWYTDEDDEFLEIKPPMTLKDIGQASHRESEADLKSL